MGFTYTCSVSASLSGKAGSECFANGTFADRFIKIPPSIQVVLIALCLSILGIASDYCVNIAQATGLIVLCDD